MDKLKCYVLLPPIRHLIRSSAKFRFGEIDGPMYIVCVLCLFFVFICVGPPLQIRKANSLIMAQAPLAIAVGTVMVVGAAAQAYSTLREELRNEKKGRQRATRAAQRLEQKRQEANRALKKTTQEKRDILRAQKSEQEIEYKEAHQRVLEISVQLDEEDQAIRKFRVEREDDTAKVIVTLGMTGCGKSTLCNRLMGDSSRKGDGSTLSAEDRCTTSGRGGSCTILPQKMTVEIGESKITVIDTPGFNDSSGKDRYDTAYCSLCARKSAFFPKQHVLCDFV